MALTLANLLGPWELIILALFGVLVFGKRLPDVGRSLGKGIIEFKKGLHGIEEEIEQASSSQSGQSKPSQPALPPGYKFDPYTGKPIEPPAEKPQMRFDPYTGKPLGEQPAGSEPVSTPPADKLGL